MRAHHLQDLPARSSSDDRDSVPLAMTNADHLVYADDRLPGISRRRRGKGFSFHLPGGERITDKAETARLMAIGMPPAYQRCWFNPDCAGHIQATGYDAKGRKQYRYHPDFRQHRDFAKFSLCVAFGQALPAMRARVDRALRARTMTRERCLAAIVRLLDIAHIRIGNRQYAQQNRSFGVSTLRKRHVTVRPDAIELKFVGKSGKLHHRILHDRALLKIVRDLQDLPGQHLFKWVDEDGQIHAITSGDVNRTIAEVMGAGFSAKHFRTWHGTLAAFRAWRNARGPVALDAVMRIVADELGNTPAVSRKSYVHPAVIAAIRNKSAPPAPTKLPPPDRWLQPEERALIAFLKASASAVHTPARNKSLSRQLFHGHPKKHKETRHG